MRAVCQRVSRANVMVDGDVVGEIGIGWMILLGIGPGDDDAMAARMADKIVGLRVFDDGDGADIVTDFQNGSDKCDLTQVAGIDEFSDLVLTDTGAGVEVDYGTGSFELANVANFASIDASDFIFA